MHSKQKKRQKRKDR